MLEFFNNFFSNRGASRLTWDNLKHQPAKFINSKELIVGSIHLHNQALDLGNQLGTVDIEAIAYELGKYGHGHPLETPIIPQCAAVVYDVTHNPHAMNLYFPLLAMLDPTEIEKFHEKVFSILQNPNFNLRIWDIGNVEVTERAPQSIAFLLAGHIVEIFYYRQDFLYQFFRSERNFNIFMNHRSYLQGGGYAGGCYDPDSQSIKLMASRLYEGFFDKIPGVAPFIHELGHMLDTYYVRERRQGPARGFLPGMMPYDGAFFSAESREKFIAGKHLELKRYQHMRNSQTRDAEDFPIGHPYVFQSDGEFIAGYLEMFFRNPNHFAVRNPILYESFRILLKQDPRQYFKKDFNKYIEQNYGAYYNRNHLLPASGLKVFS